MSKQQIGVVGMAVMGRNLALNIESRGYTVSIFNRSREKTDEVIAENQGKKLAPYYTIEEFVESLEKPRRILLMVQAGEATDKTIASLTPHLDKGDILIDGGKGQLSQAKQVFAELDVEWDKSRPILLGVAKGSDRKAGLETLFFEAEGEGVSLPPDSAALHVIQHIRDDAHNHAISGHRKKRAKVKNTSALESIEGIGPKRRQQLLKYMGGLQPLMNATVEEIANVPGISFALAEKIYHSLKH